MLILNCGLSRLSVTKGFGRCVYEEGFGRCVCEEGFGRCVCEEGFGRCVYEEGFGRCVCEEGFGRCVCALAAGKQSRTFGLCSRRVRGTASFRPLTDLGGEHVDDPVHRTLQQQPAHQEAQEYHVGEQGAEVHYLRDSEKETKRGRERQSYHTITPSAVTMDTPCLQSRTQKRTENQPSTRTHRARTCTNTQSKVERQIQTYVHTNPVSH